MRGYELTDQADEDLIDIWLYTDEKWSEDQANKYIFGLHECFDNIVSGHKLTNALSEVHPMLETCRCQKHHIFFLRLERPVIIAVFHERMLLMKRLSERLGV